jgi:asparagine synthase (glutamine-hydrolysing)
MGVQFGKWNFEGQPLAADYIEKVSSLLAPYGPDTNESYSTHGVTILYRAFHTTPHSRREKQPCVSSTGAVITWDGRLDNRTDLISALRDPLTVESTDLDIVTAAYEKWAANCFGKLIGDWALSIWNPTDRSLILAKDPIGMRHLYYSSDDRQVTWSTILDPLVLFADKPFALNEEYIAGWFSHFPAAHLTPYLGIHAVPPSSYVVSHALGGSVKQAVNKHWDFNPRKRIRYRSDAEYEEHFRIAFAAAVQRRLRSDRPILAELSGGIDSSSIVCMADTIIARGQADCPRLDTITWYDASEPNWGELPHFTRVEEKRGHVGHHINCGSLKADDSQRLFGVEFANDRFAATPILNTRPSDLFEQNAAHMRSGGYRVTLSGIGGGGVTGDGVPTPTPELQNLLVRGRFVTLVRQLNAWAEKMRKPRLPLLWEAVQGFLPERADVPKEMDPTLWLRADFVRRNHIALCGYPSQIRLFGPLPSFQDNVAKLEANRRFLEYRPLRLEIPCDVRYPYLDRDLLEFTYAIPREQIVRVGQRRSLMRRAFVGIVPGEVLNRKKKEPALQERRGQSPMTDRWTDWASLAEMGQHMIGNSVGIIDRDRFGEALQMAQREDAFPFNSLKRTVILEFWLRHIASYGVLKNCSDREGRQHCSSLTVSDSKDVTQPTSSAS